MHSTLDNTGSMICELKRYVYILSVCLMCFNKWRCRVSSHWRSYCWFAFAV